MRMGLGILFGFVFFSYVLRTFLWFFIFFLFGKVWSIKVNELTLQGQIFEQHLNHIYDEMRTVLYLLYLCSYLDTSFYCNFVSVIGCSFDVLGFLPRKSWSTFPKNSIL